MNDDDEKIRIFLTYTRSTTTITTILIPLIIMAIIMNNEKIMNMKTRRDDRQNLN